MFKIASEHRNDNEMLIYSLLWTANAPSTPTDFLNAGIPRG